MEDANALVLIPTLVVFVLAVLTHRPIESLVAGSLVTGGAVVGGAVVAVVAGAVDGLDAPTRSGLVETGILTLEDLASCEALAPPG